MVAKKKGSRVTPAKRREIEKRAVQAVAAALVPPAQPAEEAPAQPAYRDPGFLLDELHHLVGRRRLIDHQIDDRVRELREAEVSWHRIAVVLGVTAEGARKRFGT